ncbi:MAG TPA: DNA repair protein RecN, partial [Pyrinomonadaceae bacterium]|nr:DNA repair protein RecN [Pyrinomonadaceae bacterium]
FSRTMLTLLHINNIALIDELRLEFGEGLNLLTGETGSGKSIIVDSLGALTGERVSADLIKEGTTTARIEGLFSVEPSAEILQIFDEAGLDVEPADFEDLIVRRELSATGKNRIFVNNQLVTQNFLKRIGAFLVDIHGQGEQQTLFDPRTHLEMLDNYAGLGDLRKEIVEKYRRWQQVLKELESLRSDETQKLQLIDILQFQIDELKKANLQTGEDEELETERRRLMNVEKLSALSDEAYALLYESSESAISNLALVAKNVDELTNYDAQFGEYNEQMTSAQAVLEDLAITLRSFRGSLEFSPERLSEIESRLSEIQRLKRKYGSSIESALAHLAESEERLSRIESAELREAELLKQANAARADYLKTARETHERRETTAREYSKAVETALKDGALERARFEVRVNAPENLNDESSNRFLTAKGFDAVEFYFSANVGESLKPIARVASGGEASRLMLVLKTTGKLSEQQKTAVFDEIDVGISGRVSEAVGRKLKKLAAHHQVLCVTHQPQVAALADAHFVVEKEMSGERTTVQVGKLNTQSRVEELARMLTGATVTDSARRHAKELLKAAA